VLAWLALMAAMLCVAGLLLRWRSSQNVVARLNAIFGPLLFACAWLYGVVFEPGRNFGVISEDGFWGYWFWPRAMHDIRAHVAPIATLLGIGAGLLVLFAIGSWRRASKARGTFGPLAALALWCAGALIVYYVPWSYADIVTHYAAFDHGVDDVGELYEDLAKDGAVLAALLAMISMALAWWLTARSFSSRTNGRLSANESIHSPSAS
jgi:hypothetical protein